MTIQIKPFGMQFESADLVQHLPSSFGSEQKSHLNINEDKLVPYSDPRSDVLYLDYAVSGLAYCDSLDQIYAVGGTTSFWLKRIDVKTHVVTNIAVDQPLQFTRKPDIIYCPTNNGIFYTDAYNKIIHLSPTSGDTFYKTDAAAGIQATSMVYCPANDKIYISTDSIVYVMDPHTHVFVAYIAVETMSNRLVYCPANSNIFVSSERSTTMSIIDTNTNIVSSTMVLPAWSSDLVYCPTTRLMYVYLPSKYSLIEYDPLYSRLGSTIVLGKYYNVSNNPIVNGRLTYCPSSDRIYVSGLFSFYMTKRSIVSIVDPHAKQITKIVKCADTGDTGPILYCPSNNSIYTGHIRRNGSTPGSSVYTNEVSVIDTVAEQGPKQFFKKSIECSPSDAISGTSHHTMVYVPTTKCIVSIHADAFKMQMTDPLTNNYTKFTSLSGNAYSILYCPYNDKLYVSYPLVDMIVIYNTDLTSYDVLTNIVAAADMAFCPVNNCIYITRANTLATAIGIFNVETNAYISSVGTLARHAGTTNIEYCPSINAMFVSTYYADATASNYVTAISCYNNTPIDENGIVTAVSGNESLIYCPAIDRMLVLGNISAAWTSYKIIIVDIIDPISLTRAGFVINPFYATDVELPLNAAYSPKTNEIYIVADTSGISNASVNVFYADVNYSKIITNYSGVNADNLYLTTTAKPSAIVYCPLTDSMYINDRSGKLFEVAC